MYLTRFDKANKMVYNINCTVENTSD